MKRKLGEGSFVGVRKPIKPEELVDGSGIFMHIDMLLTSLIKG